MAIVKRRKTPKQAAREAVGRQSAELLASMKVVLALLAIRNMLGLITRSEGEQVVRALVRDFEEINFDEEDRIS
jgi:hypothetical protein